MTQDELESIDINLPLTPLNCGRKLIVEVRRSWAESAALRERLSATEQERDRLKEELVAANRAIENFGYEW